MKNKLKILLLQVLCLFLSHTFIYGQSKNDSKHTSHHPLGKHHIALFNGATTNFSHKSTSYTVGLDYEYRFYKLLGLGLLGDYIAAESGEILTGIPVTIHPFKGTKFIAAPLVLFSEDHHNTGNERKKEAGFSFRIGTGYDFHVGKLSLGPVINFDFGDTESLNYGLSMGLGF